MKILVIGSGGREHALVSTFERQGHTAYCLPGNAGTAFPCERDCSGLARTSHQALKKLKADDSLNQKKFADFAKDHAIDLTVVGPEQPLADGIIDYFIQQRLPIFGPTQQAARLESSKVWAKRFLKKYAIPTADYVIVDSDQVALPLIQQQLELQQSVVIKADGLRAGKGVFVCTHLEDALSAWKTMQGKALLEERLVGPEVSVFALFDENHWLPMLPARDYKRLLDGNRGPNTGGMGAYVCQMPVSQDILAIISRTHKALQKEAICYRGLLYFGLIETDSGPKVLEFNCRFGDPETQALLPLLKSDLAEAMLSVCHGQLSQQRLEWKQCASVSVCMASQGYPAAYQTGFVIEGLEEVATAEDVTVFHAGTKKNVQGQTVTSSGRVLSVTALGRSLEQAAQKAYAHVEKIRFVKAFYRKDIAVESVGNPLSNSG
ncbi:MAG: phosphoribosylamine--glycine ligase [Chlamydiota bacterium]